jgi:hypothetical protein
MLQLYFKVLMLRAMKQLGQRKRQKPHPGGVVHVESGA